MLKKLSDSNFNFNISPTELPKLLQDAYDYGQIQITTRVCNKDKYVRGYEVSSMVVNGYDLMLQQVGLLELKREVKLKL